MPDSENGKDLAPAPLKPPFVYFGGKTTLAPKIAALLPAHEHYVEPFCGSLAVLLAKAPSHIETVNDLDGQLIEFWRVLRDRPEELVHACAMTPHSRTEFRAAYEPSDDELERARRTWVILAQGRVGTLRASKTGWRHFVKPGGSGSSMPAYLDAYVERMAQVAGRLRSVSIESMPAIELIAKYGGHPGVCIYLDPPYEGTTRPRTWDGYKHEMRAEDDHRELLEAVKRCEASVVISGYRSQLYDELLDGWDSVEFAAFTGQATEHADVRSRARIEVVWCNRDLDKPADLFTLMEASA